MHWKIWKVTSEVFWRPADMVIGIEAAHANKNERTGVEEYCFQVIQELKKIIPATEQVILYSAEPLRNGLEKMPSHWQVKVLPWPFYKLWSQSRLAWELICHPPDVFFAPGQLVPWYTPKKTVTTVHDVAFLSYPRAYRLAGRLYLLAMQSLIAWRSSRMITPSIFTKNELRRYYPKISDNKVTVIPLGLNREYYHPTATDGKVLEKFGIVKPFIMSIGRLEKKKNTRRIIEAFNQIRQGRQLQLVLIGKPGAGYKPISEAMVKSPYHDDIRELGYLQTNDVASLLAQAEVFVFPSLYEGFGLPLLEAMAAGCPIVTSSLGSLPEVGGEAVCYVNPLYSNAIAKAVSQLLDDETLGEKYRSRGLERIEKFSWEKTAEDVWRCIVSAR